MPMYEYECRETGEVLELLRSMDDADKPVEDPAGEGRNFVRRHSIFGVGGVGGNGAESLSPPPTFGGGCGCGRPGGGCGH